MSICVHSCAYTHFFTCVSVPCINVCMMFPGIFIGTIMHKLQLCFECIYVCVCMHVCVCMYVCICVCTPSCM
jgi:hypothetical protein